MRKRVLSVPMCGLQLLISVVLSTVPNVVKAQADHCVDAEFDGVYSMYPKVIGGVTFQWNGAAWNVPTMKQTKIENINISAGMFRGLLEYKPDSYALPANSSEKYPVIIFFHGFGSLGNGTTNQLCRILKDAGGDLSTHKSLPGRVERNPELFSQEVDGNSYEYLVISPQFTKYIRPVDESQSFDFPSANEVSAVIDYVVQNYRIDESRIYLTGLSNGANMIMEYAASSVERASRVAAIMPVSLCSPTTSLRNTQRSYVPANIAAAGLPIWFVQCQSDNPCGVTPPTSWYNDIISLGGVTPRFTVIRNALADNLYKCNDSLTHDAWSRAYNPEFTASFVGGTGANDGINQNMYRWFLSKSNAVLPVKLKSFTANFVDDRVELKWVTTSEKNNASFTVERAGDDQKFVPIHTIAGVGDHSGDKEYFYVDSKPLPGIGFYRLAQTDIDGKKTFFDIKKVLNVKNNQSAVIISPNPFKTTISANLNLDRSQKVVISLTDMTGKIIRTVSSVYEKGSTEVKINTHDIQKGIYVLKISGENFSTSKKIVRN